MLIIRELKRIKNLPSQKNNGKINQLKNTYSIKKGLNMEKLLNLALLCNVSANMN